MKNHFLLAKALSLAAFAAVLALPFVNLTPSITDALTLSGSVTVGGRLENGNVVSDADPTPEVPNTANVLGAGNVTFTWDQVTQDAESNPVTPDSYNVSYKLTSANSYTTVSIPNNYNGYALNLSTGSYDYYIDVVLNGCPSGSTVYQVTVP